MMVVGRVAILVVIAASALAGASPAWVAPPLRPCSRPARPAVGGGALCLAGCRMQGGGIPGGGPGGIPGLALLREAAAGGWVRGSAAAAMGAAVGGVRGVLAAVQEEEFEYEEVEEALEAAADVVGQAVDAVADSADAPDMVKVAAKAAVAVGVAFGLAILYIPPKIETIETIEWDPTSAEDREKMVATVEKLTGEEFPGGGKKEG